MNELALFAGAGGGILGGHLLGWRTVCAVEWDAYAASVLVQRQNDDCLPPVPIWDDVQTFDGRPWQGRVDVISGGFPCTDISSAGKGAGIDGKQSGMWAHMARIVGEVRPEYVFVENSPLLVGRGLARVLGDLASLGYDARWGVLGAHHVAAPHRRDRIWIVADSHGSRSRQNFNPSELRPQRPFQSSCYSGKADQAKREEEQKRKKAMADTERTGLERQSRNEQRGSKPGRQCKEARRSISSQSIYAGRHSNWWDVEPKLGRVAHGVAHRVDRLKCIGNGQVPQCAALAWQILSGQNYEHIQPAEHRPN